MLHFFPVGERCIQVWGLQNRSFCHHPASNPLILCFEKVFISADWEPLGFKKMHHTITEKFAVRLKIRERPSASAVIDVLKKTPPKNKKEAVSWFELLASKGGESADWSCYLYTITLQASMLRNEENWLA